MADYGLIQTLTAEEVEARNRQAATPTNTQEEVISGLVSHIAAKWTEAKRAKVPVEEAMMRSVRQRRGEYDPEKLKEIQAAEQPEIFMNITDTKCRNAVAWVNDILFAPNTRIIGAEPTPVPDLPPEVVQKIQAEVVQQHIQMAVMQAQASGTIMGGEEIRESILRQSSQIQEAVKNKIISEAKKMADHITDQIDDDYVEGGFYTALKDAIEDIISLKAGFVKGPIFRRTKVKVTVPDATGRLRRVIQDEIIPEYERRSPFSIFPSPRSTGINAGYLFDVIILKPKQLYNLIGVDGFKEDEIRAVLAEFRDGSLKNDWLELSLEAKEGLGEEKPDSTNTSKEENIYCLELWDELPGELLLEWGMSEEDIPDPDDHYNCCLWQIGKHVIKAMLNYDTLGRKPFGKASFQNENDSFWGSDIPEKIKDCQQVCNASARAILANVGMGSLPQVELNTDRLEPNAPRKIWPGKTWLTTDDQIASGSRAVNFYQPQMVTEQLMRVYSVFSKIADEHSGIPAYAHGDAQVGGAGNTASGLHQLIQQAARGLKAVVRNIDDCIIAPLLELHYDYILDNYDIYGLVGDYKVRAKGTEALIAKEQLANRKIEFLQHTANPIDLQLVGTENRRKTLFDIAKSLGINLDETVVPVFDQPQMQQQAPPEKPPADDLAGNPAQGTDVREFNQRRIA